MTPVRLFRFAVLVFGLGLTLGVAADSDRLTGRPLAGRPLAEALRELAAEGGMRVVFSDLLVPPRLAVAVEPRATAGEALLAELLAPHGLEARLVAAGVWGVARRRAEGGGATTPMAVAREEIVVRPEGRRLPWGELGSLGVDRDDGLATLQPDGDLFLAVAALPGATGEEGSAAIAFGGDPSATTAVVVDGHEVVEPLHLRELGGPRSVFAPSALAAVRALTGPTSAYAERAGGVLELVTVAPTTRRSHLEWGTESEAVGTSGSFRGFGWLVALRQGRPATAEDLAPGGAPPRFWDGLAKLTAGLGPRQDLRASFLVARNDFAFGGFPFDQLQTGDQIHDVWANHHAVAGRRLEVATVGSWSRLDRDRFGIAVEGDGFAIEDVRRVREGGLRQDWRAALADRHELELGVDLRRVEVGYQVIDMLDYFRWSTAGSPEPPPPIDSFATTVDSGSVAAYVSDRLRWSSGPSFELGLRFDRVGWSGERAWSPRLALAAQAGREGVVRLDVARSHRFQRAFDLRVADGETAFLPAERADRIAVGYGRRFASIPGLAARVEGWHRRVDDPWPRHENRFRESTPFPEVEDDRVHFQPESRAASGVELTVEGRAGSAAGWRATYAWGRAADQLDGRSIPLRHDQTHAVTLGLDLRLPGAVDFHALGIWHSGRPTTAFSAAGVDPPPLFGERLPDYRRLDLAAAREWRLGGWSLRLHAELANALDRANVRGFERAGDDAAPSPVYGQGRRFTGGVTLAR